MEVELTLPMDCIASLEAPETGKGTASGNGVVHWDVGQIKDEETFTLSVLATLDPACEGEELEAMAAMLSSQQANRRWEPRGDDMVKISQVPRW